MELNLITSFHNEFYNLPADAGYCHKLWLARTAVSFHGKKESQIKKSPSSKNCLKGCTQFP
jgi:hypothetical protein